VKKNSTPEHLKQHEVDYQAEDEREHSEELKEREKDKDQQSELERLRAAARAVQMANRLKREEEDEIAELRRTIAAGRRSITPQVQTNKDKTNSAQEDDSEFEVEKERRRKKENEIERKTNPHRSPKRPHKALETFTDDEKELHRISELERHRAAARAVQMANRLKREEDEIAELRRTIAAGRRSITPQVQPSKDKTGSTQEDDSELEDEKERRRKKEDETRRKTNPRRSPKRPHRALETFTDDEKELHRISKTRTERRKLSSTPPQFEETEEDLSTDEEESPPPKRSPKVARKPQIPPGSLPREVDDLKAQFQAFGTPLGSARSSPHGSRSSSPMYYSPYGSPLPPSMPPNGYGYGYGGGAPGTVINTGVGNVTNSVVSNVGNDNSVQKVYRK
jgi:HAMP domain-containing protein